MREDSSWRARFRSRRRDESRLEARRDDQGDAPEGLLDSYASERHPVGAQILDWSRAQVVLMRPSASSRALEAIIRDLMDTRDGATCFAGRVWGVGIGYDLGGRHPLVGRSVPDFGLHDGDRLNLHLRNGRGVLLDSTCNASLRALATCWSDRIDYVAYDATDALGAQGVLVRPDGVTAWATKETANLAEVASIAARWFGEPTQQMSA